METDPSRKYAYHPKPRNGMILVTFKKDADLNKNNHPSTFTQYEWNKRFDVEKLKSSWKQRAETDFQINEQKFPFNIMTKEVLEAKQFVKDLIENDVLEIKRKRWNVSSQVATNKEKIDHKKRLYELKHGLISFTTTPKIKKKKAMHHISPNDSTTFNSHRDKWNMKAILEPEEKRDMSKRIKHSAKQNSKAFWNEHSKSSNKIGNSYISPYDEYVNDLKLLKKIKKDTQFERDEVEKEVRYLHPGATNYPEKINAIVYKEMKDIYEAKLNKVKTNKIEIDPNTKKQKKVYCDTEISEKIVAIKEWKENDKNNHNLFQTEVDVQEYLIPLMTHSNQLQQKENEVASKRERDNEIEEKKSMISAQAVANYNKYHNNREKQPYIIPRGRYPVNEYLLEDSKKNINFYSEAFIEKPITEGNIVTNDKNKDSNFLTAYKQLSVRAIEASKVKNEKHKDIYIDKGTHLGTYRIFKNEEGLEYYAWSCCMKESKTSRGCQKIVERKHKWNLD